MKERESAPTASAGVADMFGDIPTKQEDEQTLPHCFVPRTLVFDLCKPLGLTLSDSSKLGIDVLGVERGSQADIKGVIPSWQMVSVGDLDLSLHTPEDRVDFVSNYVANRKTKIKQLQSQGKSVEDIRHLKFRFRPKDYDKDENDHNSGVMDAFTGYSSPNAGDMEGEEAVMIEQELMSKITEVHRALIETVKENQAMQYEIDAIMQEHDRKKSEWVERERIALLEVRTLQKEAEEERNPKSSRAAKKSPRERATTSPRLRTTVKSRKAGTQTNAAFKKPFSSGISQTSHRFRERTETGVIRIPQELLSLQMFDDDFPRPVFRIKLSELQ
mmetsp:Transcript_27713/g.38542  ORF Transcript_27713/g.38542 Transcript_27713/m.38542 type:complete len:330 (+) Transcript_27713:77-1066(+)